jgi:hypothetical protein
VGDVGKEKRTYSPEKLLKGIDFEINQIKKLKGIEKV